ncbi:Uncharacterised protein [Mycobacteroides abscessus subsp. abscessus]|nr:Uncharacterised protein [Mycobacteroides abscessus subsp. abscessus]
MGRNLLVTQVQIFKDNHVMTTEFGTIKGKMNRNILDTGLRNKSCFTGNWLAIDQQCFTSCFVVKLALDGVSLADNQTSSVNHIINCHLLVSIN